MLLTSACAPRIFTPSPLPSRQPVPQTETPSPQTQSNIIIREKPGPRIVASLQLVEQAKALIDDKRPDAAINVLERAISIHPASGQSFYYLAEAWMLKENTDQAKEFNRLAAMYLEKDAQWSKRIEKQQARIRKLVEKN